MHCEKNSLLYTASRGTPRSATRRARRTAGCRMTVDLPEPGVPERPATTTLLDASLLVAGTTVGAGILALPAKTLPAGLGPTTLGLVGACVCDV